MINNQTTPAPWPLHLSLDTGADPEKFQITALGHAGPWRVLTPAEGDDMPTRWQLICATFEDAIWAMDTWIRYRQPGARVSIQPGVLFGMISDGRIAR